MLESDDNVSLQPSPPLLKEIWDDANDRRHAILTLVPSIPWEKRVNLKMLSIETSDDFSHIHAPRNAFRTIRLLEKQV